MTNYEYWMWAKTGQLRADLVEALITNNMLTSEKAIADGMWKCGGWRAFRPIAAAPNNAAPISYSPEDAIKWYIEWRRQNLGNQPPPAPPNPDRPILIGNWDGNFLTSQFFFGPSVVNRDRDTWRQYFQFNLDNNWPHVLVNAHQIDWGPSKGHPEWTRGGFDAYRGNDIDRRRLVEYLEMARHYGLTPWVGLIDQNRLTDWSINKIIDETTSLVTDIDQLVGGYMLSWEIREVWRDSYDRESKENLWIEALAQTTLGRPVGIHYQAASKTVKEHDDGLGGGVNRYKELESIYPQRVVRMLQYHNEADFLTMKEQTRRTCDRVHVQEGLGMFMGFEFASGENQPLIYTPAQQRERRQWVQGFIRDSGISGDRSGTFN